MEIEDRVIIPYIRFVWRRIISSDGIYIAMPDIRFAFAETGGIVDSVGRMNIQLKSADRVAPCDDRRDGIIVNAGYG